jgi:hypothetical protein
MKLLKQQRKKVTPSRRLARIAACRVDLWAAREERNQSREESTETTERF